MKKRERDDDEMMSYEKKVAINNLPSLKCTTIG